MGKPFYVDYVNHMLRFYASSIKKGDVQFLELGNEADILNWCSVNKVLNNLSTTDKYIIVEVFSQGDTLADNVYEVSKKMEINQDVIWTLISKTTLKIAKERRLI